MKPVEQPRNSYKTENIYATDKDFCEIFKTEMTGLYSLALLLTGSRASAEHCFVTALKESVGSHVVFKEQAHSWSRRAIIKNAVQMVRPLPGEMEFRSGGVPATPNLPDLHIPVAAIMALEPFERFVFVMSVLEGYTVQDCATLLNSTRQDVTTARIRALEQLTRTGATVAPPPETQTEIAHIQESLSLSRAV